MSFKTTYIILHLCICLIIVLTNDKFVCWFISVFILSSGYIQVLYKYNNFYNYSAFLLAYFNSMFIRFEPAHEKTYNKTWYQRRLRSACASAVWSESSLIAWAFYSLQAIQRGINENPCHTGWMYRLIWVFAGHIGLIVGFVVRWLISNVMN